MAEPVAIVGISSIFAGAGNLSSFWDNIRNARDMITDLPPWRCDPVYYDPTAPNTRMDRLYCKRGGFVDEFARFDPIAHGVMPNALPGAEPDQLLPLELAVQAMEDAGWADRSFKREKAGVILGHGAVPGPARLRLDSYVRTGQQLVEALRGLFPDMTEEQLEAVRAHYHQELAQPPANTVIGIMPNFAASRINSRLDFGGPALVIDAACASTLLAIDQGCMELQSGRCDLIIAGGVHLWHDEVVWSIFCQLRALSRSQICRPFDRRADGTLVGEGIGMLVLKRLSDAERDDDKIYAVIRGSGVSSDGRGKSLVYPRTEGQVLALDRAWKAAGLDPTTADLVEAHGTGTSAGDAVELETLRRFFGPATGQRAVVGSVKSMIGHTMTCAGAPAIIKAVMALHHKELPPSLHCEEPHPALEPTKFRVISKTEPWERPAGGTPRRAGVSSFGFGGINSHVVLEEAHPSRARRPRRPAERATPTSVPMASRVCCLAASSPAELLTLLDAHRARPVSETGPGVVREGSGPCRIAVINPTPERLTKARTMVERGHAWPGRDSIWFAPKGLLTDGAQIAFVFPGVDASFRPRIKEVAEHFGLPVPEPLEPKDVQQTGVAIVRVNRLLHQVLERCGIRPNAVMGHSVGEWSALIAGGVIPDQTVDSLIHMLEGEKLELPGVFFAAAGCGAERAVAAMEGLPSISLSHDNCPHQTIFCGVESSIDIAVDRLIGGGVLCQKLSFQSGFHSPLYEPFIGPHRTAFASMPLRSPTLPVYSATSCEPFPSDVDAIRALSLRHLVETVRFRELTEKLWNEGIRAFIQVGTGSLTGFIEDTLRGKPHLAISANVPLRSGMDQLRHLFAGLYVHGANPSFERLLPGEGQQQAEPEAPSHPDRSASPTAVNLVLGTKLVRNWKPIAAPAAPRAPAPAALKAPAGVPASPVAEAFQELMNDVGRAQADVFARFSERLTRLAPVEKTTKKTISLDTHPEFIDHSLFRQPRGWTVLSDRRPIAPMTAEIQLMIEAALDLLPDRVAVGVEEIEAYQWLAVANPLEVMVTARFDGKDRVKVVLKGYCEATILVAESFPEAPYPPAPFKPGQDSQLVDLPPAKLYEDRWLFHGPAYQGIVEIGPISRAAANPGIEGTIETKKAKGALLDACGQIFGYWVASTATKDRMALPVKIERLRFWGPHPAPGSKLRCKVSILEQTENGVTGNVWLSGQDGRVWAAIERWEIRRFETNDRFWEVLTFPEKHLMSDPQPGGYVKMVDVYRGATTRDNLMRRYLGEKEREVYAKQIPRKQRDWLNGRVAAKDAVRDYLWRNGSGPLFPAEVEISNDERGRPLALVPSQPNLDLRLSISHKNLVAVARVAEGRDVGIDVEAIAPRTEEFVTLSFDPSEVALSSPGEDRDEWLTRLWAAKEAAGKLRGTGLEGSPRRLRAVIRDGDLLRIVVFSRSDTPVGEEIWVRTHREADLIIAWTLP